MFDVVFINSTANFQKLLHNVSSLVGSNESLAFEIPVVIYVAQKRLCCDDLSCLVLFRLLMTELCPKLAKSRLFD